ncbi:snoRNA binding domain protein [Ostertagia ostertagi]
MSEVPHYVLYEHAVGYALMKIKEFEDAGLIIQEVSASIADVSKFSGIIKLAAFDPFKNTEAALENANAISEGLAHADLINFLESSLPQKKKKLILGVNDSKLAGSLTEANVGIKLVFGGVVTEILRGVRVHFAHLAKDLPHHSLAKAQLSLGHSYSRGKVKFDVHRVDNMVIQSIALLDQLDKDINLFGMRIRECIVFQEILEGDEEKAAEVVEAARTSMGMDIADLDLVNIERFASRVASLTEYRQRLHEYIKDRMNSCAPSLSALIGEQVGARLISHAGSLTNLAKYPASTVQILGAEKALFRALKTRSATPKYGLLFHSSFIGRASAKNKGRISRFLANKCTIASRIDCFSEVPVSTFGEFLKGQVEERLKYFETGEVPQKNLDVMVKAQEEAKVVQEKVLKKRKKAAKKAKKIQEETQGESSEAVEVVLTRLSSFPWESSFGKEEEADLVVFNVQKLAGSLTEANVGIKLAFGGVVTEVYYAAFVSISLIFISPKIFLITHWQGFNCLLVIVIHAKGRLIFQVFSALMFEARVKFDVHRVDNMVIQSIALLDQLDKDINLFGMRIREWYSYHYPELFKLVPDQYKYAKLAVTILDRNKMHENENLLAEITEILEGDEEKAAEVVEAARTSMGMDIADLDLVNIERFASRVASLTEYRQRLTSTSRIV